MHQIRFSLGFRRRPYWGAYSASLNPLAAFKGVWFAYEGKGKRGAGKGRELKGGKERGEEKGGNGREERASHTAATLGLTKAGYGSGTPSLVATGVENRKSRCKSTSE